MTKRLQDSAKSNDGPPKLPNGDAKQLKASAKSSNGRAKRFNGSAK